MPRDPLILGFDTSAAHCAAALLSGDRVIAERHAEMGRGQAEQLMPMLETVLTEGGAGWSDLSAIGVGIGPGNFTGIRIAVSAARGLALALGIPAIGVSGFEAGALDRPRPLRATLPAPRGQVYAQVFAEEDAGAPEILSPDALPDDMPMIAPPTPQAMARAIARIAATRRREPAGRPAPLYLRPADAAPPADPPPVILDDA